MEKPRFTQEDVDEALAQIVADGMATKEWDAAKGEWRYKLTPQGYLAAAALRLMPDGAAD